MLGLLAQFESRKRASFQGKDIRSGKHAQAERSSFYSNASLAGPLRSTGITPLPRYYAPRRLPTRAMRPVMRSQPLLHPQMHSVGSPRFLTVRSTRAAPTHPGEHAWCICSLLPRRWQASPFVEGWPLS
jgi:hypothetical protein